MILSSLFTSRTSEKGWGVFTNKRIEKDTVIEISPVIVLTPSEKELIDKTVLYNYIFLWENEYACMAMGNIPIYNHANPSNCEYFQDYENETIYIKTIRRIEANDELTINYQGDFDSQEPVWFEVKF
jgi:SET domain-containing protein